MVYALVESCLTAEFQFSITLPTPLNLKLLTYLCIYEWFVFGSIINIFKTIALYYSIVFNWIISLAMPFILFYTQTNSN